MAVAKNQIEEIIDVVKDCVGERQLSMILQDLTKTEAYRKNKSFKDTIDRLATKQVEKYFHVNLKGDNL